MRIQRFLGIILPRGVAVRIYNVVALRVTSAGPVRRRALPDAVEHGYRVNFSLDKHDSDADTEHHLFSVRVIDHIRLFIVNTLCDLYGDCDGVRVVDGDQFSHIDVFTVRVTVRDFFRHAVGLSQWDAYN